MTFVQLRKNLNSIRLKIQNCSDIIALDHLWHRVKATAVYLQQILIRPYRL